MNNWSDIFTQILNLVNEMSPYLLLGFLLAGLMHVFVPGSLYSRYLASGSFKSVLYAALFGIPLPLCSCGVIPTAMSLRKEGASKGAAVSFLIATPQTGVDSIMATYSLMGLPFAIVRPIAALCTAMFGGQLVNWGTKHEAGLAVAHPHSEKPCTDDCCHNDKSHTFMAKIKEALNYAFLEMMEDIGKWLVVGLVVAGLITVLVPDSFFAIFKGNTPLSMLLVLCIAIPMYICATGSIPIAVALMMKGLTPGAALVLLMAGPACNMASMLVVNKVLGRKTLMIYLASIVLGSMLFGCVIDWLLPAQWFVPTMMTEGACCHAEHLPWLNTGCSILLFVLLANALWHHYKAPHCHDESCSCHHHSEDKDEPLQFVIKGMNCNHCRNSAMKALQEIPSVEEVEIDLASGKAQVKGHATLEEMKHALNSIGFDIV